MLKSFEKLWKPLSVVCNLNSIKIFFKSQKINAKDTKAKKSGKTNYENYESDDNTFNEKYSEVLGDMSVFNENLMNRVKELIKLLNSLEKYTNVVQGDTKPTLLEALLVYNRLFSLFQDQTFNLIENVCKSMALKLEKVNFFKIKKSKF